MYFSDESEPRKTFKEYCLPAVQCSLLESVCEDKDECVKCF